MAKRKLTPEQQKHKEITELMKKNNSYICEYCSLEVSKAGLQIALFQTAKPDWCLNNATGKMSCPNPECYRQAEEEKKQAIEKGAFHY